jgi:hypothetical protein
VTRAKPLALARGEEARASQDRLLVSQAAEPRDELDQLCVGRRPVDPADRIVLEVGVVVAARRAAELVAAEQQRYALGEQESREQIAPRALASASTAGSSVGPSTPQFQLRLSSDPSRLPPSLASLCLAA